MTEASTIVAVPNMSKDQSERHDRIDALIRSIPDFPVPGVIFRDITPLLASPSGLVDMVEALAESVGEELGRIDIVAGVEARGFIVGAPLAMRLGAGFIPIRKAGKLPGETISANYSLEYADAAIEMHADTVPDDARVLVIDDVLATGGTAVAACQLIESTGRAEVVGVRFLLEIASLAGRDALAGRDVVSIIEV